MWNVFSTNSFQSSYNETHFRIKNVFDSQSGCSLLFLPKFASFLPQHKEPLQWLTHCVCTAFNQIISALVTLITDQHFAVITGSSVHGIFQARVLEWGATAFSENNNSYHYWTRTYTYMILNPQTPLPGGVSIPSTYGKIICPRSQRVRMWTQVCHAEKPVPISPFHTATTCLMSSGEFFSFLRYDWQKRLY